MIKQDELFYLRRRMTAWEYLFKAIFQQDKKQQIDQMAQYLTPGTCVIDVGAHVGFFSRRFAHHNPGGLVLSFEPQSMPRAIMIVASFFRRNRNMVVFPFALGDDDRMLELKIPLKKGNKVGIGLAHVGENDDLKDRFDVKKELVACKRLDDVLAGVETGRISLIKIDVEGGELAVLRGASDVIGEHRPNIVCEIDNRENRFGLSREALLAFFEARDYAACDLELGTVLPAGETQKNTVFRPRESVGR